MRCEHNGRVYGGLATGAARTRRSYAVGRHVGNAGCARVPRPRRLPLNVKVLPLGGTTTTGRGHRYQPRGRNFCPPSPGGDRPRPGRINNRPSTRNVHSQSALVYTRTRKRTHIVASVRLTIFPRVQRRKSNTDSTAVAAWYRGKTSENLLLRRSSHRPPVRRSIVGLGTRSIHQRGKLHPLRVFVFNFKPPNQSLSVLWTRTVPSFPRNNKKLVFFPTQTLYTICDFVLRVIFAIFQKPPVICVHEYITKCTTIL